MFTVNKPNEAYIARQMWQRSTAPRIGILQELATKLLSEVESITETSNGGRERINFGEGFRLYDQLQKLEIDIIRHALYLAGGRQNEAARLLGIKLTTLNSKIKRLNLKGSLPSQEIKRGK